jgi:hypothetical protein
MLRMGELWNIQMKHLQKVKHRRHNGYVVIVWQRMSRGPEPFRVVRLHQQHNLTLVTVPVKELKGEKRIISSPINQMLLSCIVDNDNLK